MIYLVKILLMYIIFFLPCSFTFSQENVNRDLTSDEMDYLAMKITKIQSDLDDLIETHKKYQNDSIEYNPELKIFQFYNDLDVDCFDYEKYIKGDFLSSIGFKKQYLTGDYFSNIVLYDLFLYRYEETRHYFIAMDSLSSIYLLQNFYIDDFNRFVKRKVNNINEESIISLVKFYIKVKLNDSIINKLVIIDINNIDQYKEIQTTIKPYSIKQIDKDTYLANVYFVSSNANNVFNYEFEIKKDGSIKHKIIDTYNQDQ